MAGNPVADWLDAGDAPAPDAFDDEGPRHGRSRPRRARPAVVVGAIVWLAVATTFVLTRNGTEEPPADGSTRVEETASQDDGAAPDADDANVDADAAGVGGVPQASVDREPAGSAPGTTGDGSLGDVPPLAANGAVGEVPSDLAAAAVVGVRMEVSRLAPSGDEARYVDVAVAESVEAADDGGGLSIVRVLAVVLEGDRDGWTDTLVQRFGVPLSITPEGEPALAGRPWVLPADPPSGNGGPDWAEMEEEPAGTVAALESAGFSSVTDLTVAAAPGSDLLRVTFDATSPAGTHEVWLASDPEPRVLGAQARPTE